MNSFFGIGIMELFFIAIVAMLVLGPERLPGAIREVMKYFRMIRGVSSELTSQFSEELKMLDEINPQKLMNEFTDTLDADKEALDKKKAAEKGTTKPAATAAAAKSAAKTPEEPAVVTKSMSEVPAPDDARGEEQEASEEAEPVAGNDEENRILPPQAEESESRSSEEAAPVDPTSGVEPLSEDAEIERGDDENTVATSPTDDAAMESDADPQAVEPEPAAIASVPDKMDEVVEPSPGIEETTDAGEGTQSTPVAESSAKLPTTNGATESKIQSQERLNGSAAPALTEGEP